MTFDKDDDVLEFEIQYEGDRDMAHSARDESIVGSTPLADDDRRSGLAGQDQDQQGGQPKSKLLGCLDATDA